MEMKFLQLEELCRKVRTLIVVLHANSSGIKNEARAVLRNACRNEKKENYVSEECR